MAKDTSTEHFERQGASTSVGIAEMVCMYCEEAVIPRMNKHRTCAKCTKWLESTEGLDWYTKPFHLSLVQDHIDFWNGSGRHPAENGNVVLRLATNNEDETKKIEITDINTDEVVESIPSDWNPALEEKYYVAYMAIKDILIMALAQGKVIGYRKMPNLLKDRNIKDIPPKNTLDRYISIILFQQRSRLDYDEWAGKYADGVEVKAAA